MIELIFSSRTQARSHSAYLHRLDKFGVGYFASTVAATSNDENGYEVKWPYVGQGMIPASNGIEVLISVVVSSRNIGSQSSIPRK